MHRFDETYLRDQIRDVMPKAPMRRVRSARRSFSWVPGDGTIYNARQVVDKIGHLRLHSV